MRTASFLWAPGLWLIAITVLFAVELSFLSAYEEDVPRTTELLWSFAFSFVMAWWVHSDRRIPGVGVPFEFDAFVFFGWPIAVPYYLWRTRGRRGVLLSLGVCALFFVPNIVAIVVYLALTL